MGRFRTITFSVRCTPPLPRRCKYLHRVSLSTEGAQPPPPPSYDLSTVQKRQRIRRGWVNSKLGIPLLLDLWASVASTLCNKSECNHPRIKLRVCLFRRFSCSSRNSSVSSFSTENWNCFFVIVLTLDPNDSRYSGHDGEFVITRSADRNSSISVQDLFVTRPKKGNDPGRGILGFRNTSGSLLFREANYTCIITLVYRHFCHYDDENSITLYSHLALHDNPQVCASWS